MEARGGFQVHDEVRRETDSERRYSMARERDRRERARMVEGNGHSRRKGEGREKVKREVKEE